MDRSELMDTMYERLDQALELLDELEERAGGAGDDENDADMEDINSARRDYEEVKMMIDELEQADEDSFEEMQAAAEAALDELEESLTELEERLAGKEEADEE